ncbi:histidine kinase N-terminal 7TM domain-containing protein [Halobaculum sp. D14]|uniref:sensor histidine kinase n=1 Tax=Halobaculum sp. D14 TaxID=3421642 RepID=UPI003EB8A6F5
MFAAVVSGAVAGAMWRRRGTPGAKPLALFAAAVTVWTAGNAAQVAATTLPLKLAAVNLQYVGLLVIPPAWLWFAAAYTGRSDLLTRRVAAALAVQPAVTMALTLTNCSHHLLRLTAELAVVDGVVVLTRTFGPWFWLTMAYSNLLLAAGTVLLLRAMVRSHRLYRGQVVAVIGGTLAPFVASLAFYGGVSPIEPEVFFSVTAAGFWLALTRYGLFDVAPVARDAIIRDLPDPMFVVDGTGRVVDANPAATALLAGAFPGRGDSADAATTADGSRSADPVGSFVDDAVAGLDDAWRGDLRSVLAGDDAPEVVRFVGGDEVRYFAPHTVPAPGRDAAAGRIVLLRDVTDVVEPHRQLEQRNRQLEHVADVLSHDLRNLINVADGYLELALAGEPDAEDRVHSAHRRMNELIEETLEASRAGTGTPDVEPVSLSAAATRAWSNVDTADATLDVAEDVTLLADGSQLRTLLENLFRNSVEHAGSDVAVTVGRFADGDVDGFFVADDGPGIPAADRRSVFDRGRTGDDGGTGLGLSIVNGVADAHGWVVSIADADGGGARFEVRGVDVAPTAASAPDSESASGPASEHSSASSGAVAADEGSGSSDDAGSRRGGKNGGAASAE